MAVDGTECGGGYLGLDLFLREATVIGSSIESSYKCGREEAESREETDWGNGSFQETLRGGWKETE